jgi:hypothetical protein
MGRISSITQKEIARAHKTALLAKSEALDKAEGWKILERFKNKAALAIYAGDPNKLADLEYRYPLETYRRKLDLDNCYLAVLRK